MSNRLFAGAPTLPPDPRQAEFRLALPSLIAKATRDATPGATVHVIELQGFYASAPDLGWLQDRIIAAWTTLPRSGDHYGDALQLAARVRVELPQAVQRTKGCEVAVDPHFGLGAHDLRVSFATKDDHGWYTYHFYARCFVGHRAKEG